MCRPIFIFFVWIQARLPSRVTVDSGHRVIRARAGKRALLSLSQEEECDDRPGADIARNPSCQEDRMRSDVARIIHRVRVTYRLLHAVYADCMQWVHPAAVHWAEEKLSIYLQHLIPQPCNHAAVCSESLQMCGARWWEHITLSLNFHLLISWPSKMNNMDVFFNIAIVSFSGCYLEASCNFASILKHCKEFEFTASMRQPLPPKYFLFSSIPGHLAQSPTECHYNPPEARNIFPANLIQFLAPTWVQTRSDWRGAVSSDRMLTPCLHDPPSRRLNTISGPDSALSHSQTEIKLFCRAFNIFSRS